MSCAKAIACVSTLCLLLVTVCPTGVAAIWCFQCNSRYDENCANLEPYQTNSTYHRLCRDEKNTGREFFCRKIVQTIYDREDLVRVVRSCGYVIDSKNRTCFNLNTVGHKAIMCQCFTDSCNSAPPLANYWSPVLFSVTAIFFASKTLSA